ncbi:MAG: alanine racemase [Roseburia sp.]|nr:alanine racemase [Roseburia sp.]MCM1099261.1 alanine racemase [Ruminococcus flavefaciens]
MDLRKDIPAYCSRGYAEVKLDAVVRNICNMKERMGSGTRLMGVVKTDGYGHGSIPIARELEGLDFMWGFATATAEEAIALREAGIRKPLLILGYSFPYCYETLIREEIRPTVFRRDSLEQLQEAAARVGKPVRVHVKVDTGMNRIGIKPDEEGFCFLEELKSRKGIEIEGIFTHFARADEADKSDAYGQLQLFRQFAEAAEERLKLRIPLKHCANSAALLEMPEAELDLARAGIAMYGLYPSNETDKSAVELEPVLSLYSRIVYIKTIHAGQSVSYGGTFTAQKDMRVATVPLGYGDGYPRKLSGKGYVLIRGKRAPILGRICMDQFMADVTEIPEAEEDDGVVLLGRDGTENISAQDLGELSGRFHYELICDLGRRIPRIYTRGGEVVGCSE